MSMLKKAIALVFVAALAACSAPIKNVSQQPINTAAGSVSKNDVRMAIIRAGTGLGWVIADNGPDALVGTLRLRKHTAVVDIPYSTTNYSIQYRSSINLNERDGTIHKNYNGWIQNLTNGIEAQLQLAKS